jgi:hypothetical protein
MENTMKYPQTINYLSPALAAITFTMLSGCAAQMITPQHLQQRTEVALGMEAAQFTISDRVDDSVSTRYKVTTRDGRRFNCTVGGAFSFAGGVVTDAICHPFGNSASTSSGVSVPGCNALLKAAGRC